MPSVGSGLASCAIRTGEKRPQQEPTINVGCVIELQQRRLTPRPSQHVCVSHALHVQHHARNSPWSPSPCRFKEETHGRSKEVSPYLQTVKRGLVNGLVCVLDA